MSIQIQKIGIIGVGTMGAGIAQIAIQSGHDVILFDAKEGAAEQAQDKLAKTLNTLADKGKFSHEKAAEDIAHLSTAQQLEDLKDCDLIVEAIIENLDIKQKLMQQLEGIIKPEAILASNTSSLSISAIAANDEPDFLYAIGSGTYDNGEIDSPNLYRIDLLTGIPTIIGPLGMGTTISDYDQAGLAFDSQGVLWAITDRRIINDQKAANQPSEILRININTGAAEVVWTTQEIGFESLAIAPPIACDSLNPVEEPGDDVPHIPTLSTLGQMLAVFVLMFAGMLVLRRRIS